MPDKQQFQQEYIVNCSAEMLYQRISTPSGLSEWFADNVNLEDDVYSFFWDGNEERAKLLEKKSPEFIKLQWEDEEDEECYFEIRIRPDQMTGDLAIVVTDFAEEDEKDEAILLWDTQISKLKHILGS